VNKENEWAIKAQTDTVTRSKIQWLRKVCNRKCIWQQNFYTSYLRGWRDQGTIS